MKNAPSSHQHHDLYVKYRDHDSEISDLLGECGIRYENIAKDIVRLEKDVPTLSGLSATMQSITAKGNVRKQGKKIFHY